MNNAQYAQRIKDRCKEKGYTITEVLANCQLSRNYIYDLKMNRTPLIEGVEKIAEYLDCSIDYLIGRTNNPNINKWFGIIV